MNPTQDQETTPATTNTPTTSKQPRSRALTPSRKKDQEEQNSTNQQQPKDTTFSARDKLTLKQMEYSPIARGSDRPSNTIGKTTKKDLEVNHLYLDLIPEKELWGCLIYVPETSYTT